MEGGWFDEEAMAAERFDADMEQASYEAEGRAYERRLRRVVALLDAGRAEEAALVCTHGWSGPAVEGPPWIDGADRRCYECGAVFAEVLTKLGRSRYNREVRVIKAGAFPPDESIRRMAGVK